MKIRTIFLLLVLIAIAVFAMLNWNAFMMPTTLSLGVAVVQAPLGLVMLGLLVFLTALFLLFVAYMQASALFETHRNERDLRANRELAENAEASRFTELRVFLEAEMKRQADLHAESRVVIIERVDQLDRDLRSALEEAGNTLGAYIGELEDRLEGGAKIIQPRT
ncbi:MAG: LapA family protein [Lysobacterales bacterium]|nr:MAG: LapA family protein [Xanthomonadales bacterium]